MRTNKNLHNAISLTSTNQRFLHFMKYCEFHILPLSSSGPGFTPVRTLLRFANEFALSMTGQKTRSKCCCSGATRVQIPEEAFYFFFGHYCRKKSNKKSFTDLLADNHKSLKPNGKSTSFNGGDESKLIFLILCCKTRISITTHKILTMQK